MQDTSKKDLLKISQLAQKAGVSTPTVKHYVREGLIPRPVKTSRNMAYYSEADIHRIRLVKKLQKEKFLPLEVIKRLMDKGESFDEELLSPASQGKSKAYLPDLNAIQRAASRIAPYAHRTPVMTCDSLDRMTGARLSFKCENFQKIGAFKFRGALNAVLSLEPKAAERGVVTHSSGNHAQALALAARLKGMKAYIVMPENAPKVKIAAVKEYGAEVILCTPTLEAREAGVREVIQRTGAELIHPYDDVRVIAGQATCAMEFLQQVPDMDFIMAPVGGGGLLSGTALSTHFISSRTRVIAAEPELADDASQSFQTKKFVPAGPPQTIADGLLTSLGEITLPLILEHVNDIVTVSEQNIIAAMYSIWERMKIVVEPSGAVPLGAVMEHADRFKGRHVGIILSGGNVDLTALPWNKNC